MNGTAWLLSMYEFCKKNLALISILYEWGNACWSFTLIHSVRKQGNYCKNINHNQNRHFKTIEKDSFITKPVHHKFSVYKKIISQWNMAQKINNFWPHFEHCVILTEMPAAQKNWSVWKVVILFAFLNKNTHSFIKKVVKYWMNMAWINFWPYSEHCGILAGMPAAQKLWSIWKVVVLVAFSNNKMLAPPSFWQDGSS